jgi:SAM-dependent methyltransferase
MPETLEIDVEQLMERIRDNIGQRRSEVPPPDASTPAAESQRPADFTFLQSGYDIQHVPITSHRKVIGRFIVFAKNVSRQLLTPVIERQVALNAANAQATSYLCEQVEEMRQQQAVALQTLQTTIVQQVEAMSQQQAVALQTLRQEIAASEQRQATALQAVQTAIVEQQAVAIQTLQQEIAASEQRQATALQAVQTAIVEQVQAWRRLMERRFGGLEQMASRHHQRILTETEGRLAEWEKALTRLKTEHIQRILTETEGRLAEWEKALTRLKTEHILQERRVTMLLEETRKRLPEPLSQEQLQAIANEGNHVLEALYVSFEDQFRGTREDIKERFQIYLPILERAHLGSDKMPIVEVGSGRGEWLELLQQGGLRARGVDLNRVMVQECERRGLVAVEAEAVAYLSSLPASSVGAVTGFHIIEHLPFDLLVKLLDETVRVLKPGGAVIFETPNPANVLVGSHNFYLDPSHRNPLPSATMRFIAEARGLCRVEIMDLHPYPESFRIRDGGNDIVERFNTYFYGPQDYAVIGWKV